MTSTALKDLADNGVSIWLDDLSRERLRSGNLQEVIDTKGVVGVTTNPSIFQAALAEGDAYDEQVARARGGGEDGRRDGLRAHHARRPRRLRRLPPHVRADRGRGRPRVHRGRPRRRLRHRAHRRAGQGAARRGRPPQRAHQDPRDGRGPAGDQPGPRRGHLGQRHADLRARPLPRGDERLPHRPRAGPRERPRPVEDPLRRLVLRLPRRQRDRQAARRHRHRRGEGAARQGRPSPTPGWPTRPTRRSSRPRAGPRSPTPAPTRSARCGRPPGSRTPSTRTRIYVTELVAPGTVNTMPEKTLDATADHGEVTGDTVTPYYAEAAEVLDSLERLGHLLRRRHRPAREGGRRQVREVVGGAARRRDPRAREGLRMSTLDVAATGAAADAIAAHVPTLVADRVASRLFAQDATLWGEAAEEESAKRLSWTGLPRTSRHLVGEIAALQGRARRDRLRPRRALRHGRLVARPGGHLRHGRRAHRRPRLLRPRRRARAPSPTSSAPSSSCRASRAPPSRPTASAAPSRPPSPRPASTPRPGSSS